jgi:hypothetical protein
LAWGSGPRAFSGGVFNRDWGLLDLTDIHKLYIDLITRLQVKPFRAYDALTMLLGEKRAQEIAFSESLTARAISQMRWSHKLHSEDGSEEERHVFKQVRFVVEDEDEPME